MKGNDEKKIWTFGLVQEMLVITPVSSVPGGTSVEKRGTPTGANKVN